MDPEPLILLHSPALVSVEATFTFFSRGGGVAGGVGRAAVFFVSKEPTCSCPLNFFKMPLL